MPATSRMSAPYQASFLQPIRGYGQLCTVVIHGLCRRLVEIEVWAAAKPYSWHNLLGKGQWAPTTQQSPRDDPRKGS
jgi:hypothetical protein